MNMNEAKQLANIYNNLLLVKTSGEDTMIMGKCLELFQAFLSQISIQSEDTNKEG